MSSLSPPVPTGDRPVLAPKRRISADANLARTLRLTGQARGWSLRQGLRLHDILQVCRPRQWTKNVFLLAPLFFSRSLGNGSAVLATATAFGCFCLFSSAVYCVNDILDAPADRRHPRKCRRPVAAGRVTPWLAGTLALALAGGAALTASAVLPAAFLLLAGLYLANSLAYCLFLKHQEIADVLCIGIGFVLRLLAGCACIGVEPTSWILVCGFSLSLLLGFGKRRLEVGLDRPTEYRPILQAYSAEKLNMLLAITASLCLLSYMLYTVSPQTIHLHRTDHLVYTVPFVAYGVFRYIFQVQNGQYDGPVEILLKDPCFAVNGLLWVAAVFIILYLAPAPIPS
jgi:4-hydroxybenzoate polyprenyltransferase